MKLEQSCEITNYSEQALTAFPMVTVMTKNIPNSSSTQGKRSISYHAFGCGSPHVAF